MIYEEMTQKELIHRIKLLENMEIGVQWIPEIGSILIEPDKRTPWLRGFVANKLISNKEQIMFTVGLCSISGDASDFVKFHNMDTLPEIKGDSVDNITGGFENEIKFSDSYKFDPDESRDKMDYMVAKFEKEIKKWFTESKNTGTCEESQAGFDLFS